MFQVSSLSENLLINPQLLLLILLRDKMRHSCHSPCRGQRSYKARRILLPKLLITKSNIRYVSRDQSCVSPDNKLLTAASCLIYLSSAVSASWKCFTLVPCANYSTVKYRPGEVSTLLSVTPIDQLTTRDCLAACVPVYDL